MHIEGDDVVKLTEEERVSLRSTFFEMQTDLLDKMYFKSASKEVQAMTT